MRLETGAEKPMLSWWGTNLDAEAGLSQSAYSQIGSFTFPLFTRNLTSARLVAW